MGSVRATWELDFRFYCFFYRRYRRIAVVGDKWMHLDRKGLIEAILSVMEVKIGMCTEAEAQAVLRELQEKPYTIDLASTWESYLKASF